MESTQLLLFDIKNVERVIKRTQVGQSPQDVDDHFNESQSNSSLKRMSPVRELQPGEYTHPDYNQIIQIFEQIDNLAYANEFTDNFSREEWFSLLGSWQGVGDCIRAKCDYIERCESHRKGAITVEAWSQ